MRALSGLHWDMLRSGSSGGVKTAQQLRARLLKNAIDANVHMQGVTEVHIANKKTRKPDATLKVVPRVELHPAAKVRDAPVKHACEPVIPSGTGPAAALEPAAASSGANRGSKDDAEKKAGSLWSWIRGDEDAKVSAR